MFHEKPAEDKTCRTCGGKTEYQRDICMACEPAYNKGYNEAVADTIALLRSYPPVTLFPHDVIAALECGDQVR